MSAGDMEAQSPTMVKKSPADLTRSHRQVLANLDQYTESGSDREGTTDDEAFTSEMLVAEEDPDAVVGISMGKAQTRLKSAATPAVEKANALEKPGNYFGIDPAPADTRGEDDDDDRYWKPSDASPDKGSPPLEPPSPWKAQSSSSRLSISKVFGGQNQSQSRKRAYSGPTALIQSIRKVLPELPTPTFPKFAPSTLSSVVSRPEAKQTGSQVRYPADTVTLDVESSSGGPLDSAFHGCSPKSENERSLRGFDGSSVSKEVPLRPKVIRKATSENSLYLRRAVTGASNFDDTTVFSSVADMPNARFKAITDSLQDSTLRLPKLPNGLRNSLVLSSSRSEVDDIKQNTETNTQISSAIQDSPAMQKMDSKVWQTPNTIDTKHPKLKESLSRMTGDLIIMGGYRGSVLRSAEPPHQQVWIPVKVGLNLRKVDLEVGLTREDEERMTEKIIPSGILSHIGPIDISRRLLKKIRKCPQVKSNQLRVHDWGYDWRLSPHLLADQLIKFLESLESNSPDRSAKHRGAIVIAHSLGGLITRHAVNRRPELFSGVIYAGTPQNCVNILGPLRNGDDVLLSSRVLTAQVNFTLRTSFALLPENGRCFLNQETGERYDIDFFDPKTWDDFRLSPCINPPLAPAMKRRSLVDSISESISSFTPSLPTRRNSWFPPYNTSATQGNKEKDEDLSVDGDEGVIKSPIERLTSPSTAAGQSLEPSMKSSSKPSIATTVTIPRDQAYEYLSRTLSEIKQFKSELAHREDRQSRNEYPPQAVIFGHGVPTVYGARVASKEAIRYTDAYDDLAFASGDGVVLASAAQLPSGYRCVKNGRVKSDRGHVGLLGDLEAVGQCLGAVLEGRQRGIGLGPESRQSKPVT